MKIGLSINTLSVAWIIKQILPITEEIGEGIGNLTSMSMAIEIIMVEDNLGIQMEMVLLENSLVVVTQIKL